MKRSTGKKSTGKHPTHLGYAISKVTGKTRLDWKHLARTFKTHRAQIQRHRHDQKYLQTLKTKLETK